MIGLYLCMLLSCFSAQLVAAKDTSMKHALETRIFKNDALDTDLKEMHSNIERLHKVYSRSGKDEIYKDMIEKLVELPELKSCDEDSFMKFDLLESKPLTNNLQRYIRDQRISMSVRCDEKLVNKFDNVVYDMDLNVRDSVNQIGSYFILPKDSDILGDRYNPDEFLTESIYKFLAYKSSKIAYKQNIDREEFDDLYKTYVLGSCQGLTPEFDEMARFYIRNYLKPRTLGYCEEFSRRWTVNAKICDNISRDDGKIANFVYQLVLKQNERPSAYLYENLDEVQP